MQKYIAKDHGGIAYYEKANDGKPQKNYRFTKMHGIANDYVYFNCFDQNIEDPERIAVYLSDRHTGIGGDGIILICPSDVADAQMRMFNLDGSEGKMCGNGIRCVAKYLYDYDLVKKDTIRIETLSGIKTAYITVKDGEAELVTIDMGAAILKPEDVPCTFSGDKAVNVPMTVDGKEYHGTAVSMGNPHCVIFVDDPDKLDLEMIGPKFEHSEYFPEQVNTEFVELIDDHTLKMRVWERGSGETMACGTGACASAVAAVLNGHCKMNEEITVILRGGELRIKYTGDTVLMTGGADIAFDGTVTI